VSSYEIGLRRAALARNNHDLVAPFVMPASSAISFIEPPDRRQVSTPRELRHFFESTSWSIAIIKLKLSHQPHEPLVLFLWVLLLPNLIHLQTDVLRLPSVERLSQIPP
jgi:hypothetical protein